jgi:hypothetical protein
MTTSEKKLSPEAIEATDETEVDTSAPTDAQLDEDEAMLRALRIDLPGTANVPTGIVAISVTDRFPKREFFRCAIETVTMHLVDHVAGLETEFHAVMPSMLAELASISIDAAPYKLFQLITAEGAVKIIAVRQAEVDGSQNEWTRSKEVALTRAQKTWVRAISDMANGRYRVFEAPSGRFPEPVFPGHTWGQLIRLAFTDRGRLINSPQHPLFRKWAGHDRDVG